jgi:hypothetical protein
MARPSILCRFPLEILENVAFEVASLGQDDIYTSLTPLLCSCKSINALLSFYASSHLYARLLKARYDLRAPDRRLGVHITENEHLANQFRVYSLNLQRIRRGDISSPYILEILWTSFLMLLDNDGKNRWQLDRVRLDDFVERFVLESMWPNRWTNASWPIDGPANSLVLWIMWMLSTPGVSTCLIHHHSPSTSPLLQRNCSRNLSRKGSSLSASSSHTSSLHFAYACRSFVV